jgi:hypothetical protein
LLIRGQRTGNHFRIGAHAPAEPEQRRQIAVADGEGFARPTPEWLGAVAAEIEIREGCPGVEQLVDSGGFEQKPFGAGEVVRPHLAPPVEIVRQPLLECALKFFVFGKIYVVRNAIVKIHDSYQFSHR